ncbi:MAG TPA: hypothetical protein PLB10_15320 [Thiolinea sp.]|nr:hypothetical protein [Thiolinea sp.]
MVLPLFPEAITRQDGVEKNDCEHHASQRLTSGAQSVSAVKKS